MATNEFNVANTSLQKIQPDILGFGISDFADQLQFAENDVLRRIREEWWERYRHQVRYKDITKITSVEMDSSKLTGEGKDAFQVQIDFYRERYEEEFQAILRDGVEYDEDGGGTVSDSEKEPIHFLRLVR